MHNLYSKFFLLSDLTTLQFNLVKQQYKYQDYLFTTQNLIIMQKLLEENLYFQQPKKSKSQYQGDDNWEDISVKMNQFLQFKPIKSNSKRHQEKKNSIQTERRNFRSNNRLYSQREEKKIRIQEQQNVKRTNPKKQQLLTNINLINQNYQIKELQKQLMPEGYPNEIKIKNIVVQINLGKIQQLDFIKQKESTRYAAKNTKSSFQKLQSLSSLQKKQTCLSRQLISANFCNLIKTQHYKNYLHNQIQKPKSEHNFHRSSSNKIQSVVYHDSNKFLEQESKQNKILMNNQQNKCKNIIQLNECNGTRLLNIQNQSNAIRSNSNRIHHKKNKPFLVIKNSQKIRKIDKKHCIQNKQTKNSVFKEFINQDAQKKIYIQNLAQFNKQEIKKVKIISEIVQKRIRKLQEELQQEESVVRKIRFSSLTNNRSAMFPSIKAKSISHWSQSKNKVELNLNNNLRTQTKNKQKQNQSIYQKEKAFSLMHQHSSYSKVQKTLAQTNISVFRLKVNAKANKLVILRK